MPASLAARSRQFINLDPISCIGLSTPLETKLELCLPIDANCRWDLLSVTYNPGSTALADAGGVTLAIDRVNNAAAATTLAILAATSIVSSVFAADTPGMLFRGRISFDTAGQHLVLTFATDGALTTPAVGASICVEIEVTEYSGT